MTVSITNTDSNLMADALVLAIGGTHTLNLHIAAGTIIATMTYSGASGVVSTVSGAEVINVLERLNALGMTLIVVTHDASIGNRASRQLKMVDGRIVNDINGKRA